MQVQINGGAAKGVVQDSSNVVTINMYPQIAKKGRNDSSNYIQVPTPGKSTLCTIAGVTQVEALFSFDDKIYAIADGHLHKLTINDNTRTATTTHLGDVSLNSGRIHWARNPTQIMFGDGSSVAYILTPATDTFAAISDTDFTGLDSVVFVDSYFMYTVPNTAQIVATAINDGSSINPLDVTTAEGDPDNLLALAVDKRELWAFGTRSVQIYYNAANPTGFPFSVRDGAYIDLGCGAKDSVLKFDNSLIWLDHRKFVVRANGYSPEVISTPEMAAEFQSYETCADAWAHQYWDRGNLFYILTFPTAKKTWAFNALTQEWHQLAYWNSASGEFEHDRANCHVQYKEWNLVGDRLSGAIYIVDKDVHTEGGEPIHRKVTTKVYSQEMKFITCDSIRLRMETGKIAVGEDDPQIMLRYSNDGGYRWSNELWRSFGQVGDYAKPVIWNRLGTETEWMLEFTIVADCQFAIVDCNVDFSLGLN